MQKLTKNQILADEKMNQDKEIETKKHRGRFIRLSIVRDWDVMERYNS